MADLPKERIEESPPFTHCGIDCFGPFTVKEGRKELKRYGLIVTCLASRAIHIEQLDDMTTDCFLNALRCLIALRGPVQTIRCDQGSNFIGANNELQKAAQCVKDENLRRFYVTHNIKFIFNSPHASHMGGIWERHIRTIRSILSTMMHQHSQRLDTSTLRTFLYETMAIINSRPLSQISINDPQLNALSPNDILTMKSNISIAPPGEFVKEDVYARRRWKKAQFLANDFWHRWRKGYLNELQSRSKWKTEKRNVKVGDLVILKDEVSPRGTWKLGKVIQPITDEDGLVRRVQIQIGDPLLSKNGKRLSDLTVLERPIHKLVLLLEAE